jgi:hypothetical protein
LLGLVIGVVRGLTAWAMGTTVAFPPKAWLVVPTYVLAFVVPGVVVGLLWPLTRWWLGRGALALLFGLSFFIGLCALFFGVPTRWHEREWFVYIFSSLTLAGIAWFVYDPNDQPAA